MVDSISSSLNPNGANEAKNQDFLYENNEFDDLLKRSFRPRTDEATDAVRQAVGTLIDYASNNQLTVSRDVVLTIESLIAEIDERISSQVNNVLHHPEFQKLESAWSGLSYLVENTNISENLKIRVL